MLRPGETPARQVLALLIFLCAGLLTPFLTRDVPLLLDDLVAGPLLHDANGELSATQCLDTALGLRPEVRFNDHWRPLGWLTLILDECLLGPGALAHRWIAGLLHGCIAWLVFCIVRRLSGPEGRWPATFAGAAILCAPWSVEPVVWVAHRFTLLNALFLLAAMLMAIRWLQSGARGFPLATSLCTMAAALSKDSALTEAFALLPACWFLVVKAERRSVLGRLFLATLLPLLLMLVARWAATGTWFARYGDGTESFPLGSVIQQLPKTLEMFFLPFASNGATSRLLLLGGMATLLACLVFLWRGRARLTRERSAMLVWCAALLAAGLPALMVDAWLDGARKFLLPGAALLLGLATILPGRCVLMLAVTVLLFVCSWLERLEASHSVARGIHDATSAIATLPPDVPVLVTSFQPLPATWRGLPLFGAGATHFPLYFHPANGPRHSVRLCTPLEVSREFSRRTGPLHLVLLRQRRGDTPAFEAETFSIPPRDAEGRGLAVLQPQTGALFPLRAPDSAPDARIAFRVDGAAMPEWVLLEVGVPEGEGAFVIKLPDVRGLESTREGEQLLLRVPAAAMEGIFPVEGQERLATLFSAPGSVPARLRISVLPRPGSASAPCSAWTPFLLGAGP